MREKGFTLIELMVTIVIISILATIVMNSLSGARGNGNKAHDVPSGELTRPLN